MTSQIQIKSNTIPNNSILILRIYPDDYLGQELGLTEIEEKFYITNSQTIITSNELDVIATFSGDTNYQEEVQQAIDNEQQDTNNNNIQDITNAINETNQTLEEAKEQNKNFFDYIHNVLDNLFVMESGDVNDLKTT